jgi:murein L,D-transpeptidase YafK
MLRNIIYISASIVIFFLGLVLYGVFLNMNRESLADIMSRKGLKQLNNVSILIDRKNYKLELYSENNLIKTYKVVFGQNNGSVKKSANDRVTPAGKYFVCGIDSTHKYYKFIHINYPNAHDAAEALRKGYINEEDCARIIEAGEKRICPPEDTPLGSGIGIHGIGKYDYIFRNLPFAFNWTNGSAAVSNRDIDELCSVVKIGTPVTIIH